MPFPAGAIGWRLGKERQNDAAKEEEQKNDGPAAMVHEIYSVFVGTGEFFPKASLAYRGHGEEPGIRFKIIYVHNGYNAASLCPGKAGGSCVPAAAEHGAGNY